MGFFNELRDKGVKDIRERVIKGTRQRLRPVLLTASSTALGFFPMAFSTSAGAEVQRPLATVVIGGLITATFLTLVVLPVLYIMFTSRENENTRNRIATKPGKAGLVILLLAGFFPGMPAGAQDIGGGLSDAIEIALKNNAGFQASYLRVGQQQKLEENSF